MVRSTDPTWRDWRRGVFGDPYSVWHDGPELNRLDAAHAEDADLVDQMLVAGVGEQDALAAESIGYLEPGKAVPAALAALVAADVAPTGEFALRRAAALFALTENRTHWETMIVILLGNDHWGVRLNAAYLIGQLEPTAEAIDALTQAVADDEYLVRYHAANALLRYAGKEPDISEHELFEPLCTPRTGVKATAADRKAWADAAEKLAADARLALEDA